MYKRLASAVRCDMVLHRVFRARHNVYKHVTPHLHREYPGTYAHVDMPCDTFI